MSRLTDERSEKKQRKNATKRSSLQRQRRGTHANSVGRPHEQVPSPEVTCFEPFPKVRILNFLTIKGLYCNIFIDGELLIRLFTVGGQIVF